MGIYFDQNRPTTKGFGYNIINEVYFGESDGLNKILEQLGVIRSKYKRSSKYFSKINTDPEMIKLNRLFEDFFGFETFCVVITETSQYNAYTFPISGAVDTRSDASIIETTKTGFRFKKKCGINIFMVIYSGLFFDQSISDRECLAIMLHEIGHSFAAAMHPVCTLTSYIYKAQNLTVLLLSPIMILMGNSQAVFSSSNALRGWANRTAEKIKREHPEMNDMFHSLKGMSGIISDILTNAMVATSAMITIFNPIGALLNSVYSKVESLLTHPMEILQILFGYKDEQVADNFATLYGYGPDLSSGLQKMQDEGFGIATLKGAQNMPIIGHLYDLFSLPINMICGLMDPHPETAGRINSQLKYLKNELKNQSMDPKMKKRVIKDIESIEKTINDTYKSVTVDDPMFFSKSYAALLLSICGGDIRNIFDKPENSRYDKLANKTRI